MLAQYQYLKRTPDVLYSVFGYKLGTDYNYEIGYETLQKDFKRYQKETPKGVSLQNKRNKTIILKFKINGKPKSKGCNCAFTLLERVSKI